MKKKKKKKDEVETERIDRKTRLRYLCVISMRERRDGRYRERERGFDLSLVSLPVYYIHHHHREGCLAEREKDLVYLHTEY